MHSRPAPTEQSPVAGTARHFELPAIEVAQRLERPGTPAERALEFEHPVSSLLRGGCDTEA